MGLILILVAVIIVGGILSKISNQFSDLEVAGNTIMTIGIIVLFVALVGLPFNIHGIKVDIAQYEQTKITIEEQRNNKEISELERASLLTEIIKQNEELISYKMDNATFMFGIYVPDEIDNLELLK